MQRPNTLVPHLIGCLALALAACNNCPPPPAPPPPPDMAALTTQIQAMEDAYASSEVAKDADGVVKYYSDDVVSYMSNKEPLSGKSAVRDRIAEQIAKDSLGVTPTYKVIDLFPGGDYMTEFGSWSNADSTGTETDHGTYMSVFRKKGDGWECIREMAVSSMPKEKKQMAAEKKKPTM